MQGIEKFKREMEIAKENIKLANDYILLIDFWNKKDSFNFVSISGDIRKLFGGADRFFTFSGLELCNDNVEFFLTSYKTNHDFDHEQKSKIKRISKIIDVFTKMYLDDYDRFYHLTNDFEDLIN